MARVLYTAFFYLISPLVLLRLLWRSRKSPGYRRRIGERFGFSKISAPQSKIIWLHSVSVGETLAAIPLVEALQKQFPDFRLLITTMTPTGSDRVIAHFGNSVEHCFAPYDLPDALARFLDRVRPHILLIMETELWPNTIAACRTRQIPVILMNARLSAKSAAGYRRVSALARPMLSSLNAVAAQHADDAARFAALGLPAARIKVTGNIKFDLSIPETMREKAAVLQRNWRGDSVRSIWLAASTHRGEDEIVLQAFLQVRQRFPDLLLVLVPRHPERFEEVAGQCLAAGWRLARRSEGGNLSGADVLLGDSMGELLTFFGACDLAFMGGSLVPVGGHNMIEPAAWGKPVLSGPHLFNFSEASQLLLNAKAMHICGDADGLASSVARLLDDVAELKAMGERAFQVAESNRGALKRLLGVIEPSLCR